VRQRAPMAKSATADVRRVDFGAAFVSLEVGEQIVLPPAPRGAPELGCLRLFAALLADAVELAWRLRKDTHGGKRSRRVAAEEARRWIGGAPALISFAQACSGLGLDASAVRAAAFAKRNRRMRNRRRGW
jgi:hypothetical protein